MLHKRLSLLGLAASSLALVGALVGGAVPTFACTGATGCFEPAAVSLGTLSGGLNLPSVVQNPSDTVNPTIGGPANGQYGLDFTVQDFRGDMTVGWKLFIDATAWTGGGGYGVPTQGQVTASTITPGVAPTPGTPALYSPLIPSVSPAPAQFNSTNNGALGTYSGNVKVGLIQAPGNAVLGPYSSTVTITVASAP